MERLIFLLKQKKLDEESYYAKVRSLSSDFQMAFIKIHLFSLNFVVLAWRQNVFITEKHFEKILSCLPIISSK